MHCVRCGHVADGCPRCGVNDHYMRERASGLLYCSGAAPRRCYEAEMIDQGQLDPRAFDGNPYKVPWFAWNDLQDVLAELQELYKGRERLWLTTPGENMSDEEDEEATAQYEWLRQLQRVVEAAEELPRFPGEADREQ